MEGDMLVGDTAVFQPYFQMLVQMMGWEMGEEIGGIIILGMEFWEDMVRLFRQRKPEPALRLLHLLIYIIGVILMMGILAACSVSYKFNGASIDYTKTKTIQIAEFPIRSSYVWGPMGPMFNNALKDEFANHTRLQQVKRNGDLKIEGEITQYSQRNKSVSSEGYSAQTELSTNNVNHTEDFERQFTSSKSYETTQSLASVQEELVNQMVKDLVEQIFNATVANW